MNSGYRPEPEDQRPSRGYHGSPPEEDQDVDWATWRQGAGYSRPVPPQPEYPDPHSPELHSTELREPGPRHADPRHADPRHADPLSSERPYPEPRYPDPRYPDPLDPAAYSLPSPYGEPGVYSEPIAQGEPGVYSEPAAYRDPAGYPDPAGYGESDQHGDPAHYPESGSYGGPIVQDDHGGYPEPAAYGGAHGQPGAYSDPGIYSEPGYGPPEGYVEPSDYPEPDYPEPGDHREPAGQGESAGHGEHGGGGDLVGFWGPGNYDEPAAPGALGRYPDPDVEDLGRYPEPDVEEPGQRPDEPEDYSEFWRSGNRGLHASKSDARKAIAELPRHPSRKPEGGQRRQTGFLVAVVAVIVAASATAIVLFFAHHARPIHHPLASQQRTTSTGSPRTSSPASGPASPAPPIPLTGAYGHLGIPRQIGSVKLNPQLTQRFVGSSVRLQDANSFFIPPGDVVSGFYTASPSSTSFTASQPRLMFISAYLDGSGDASSALHEFMTTHTFYGQHSVNPGKLGGVAACGLLPQQPTPVAHCMWADANTYTDFYAWNSSPSALASAMLAVRPSIELAR
jgi:hypothetical protein